jgi:hypothetical protein
MRLGESMLLGALGGWGGIWMAGLVGYLGRGLRLSFAKAVARNLVCVGLPRVLYCQGRGHGGRTGCRVSVSFDIQCENMALHIT